MSPCPDLKTTATDNVGYQHDFRDYNELICLNDIQSPYGTEGEVLKITDGADM